MAVTLYACPTPTALPDVDPPGCTVQYGNIIAVAFQMKQATPSFDATTIKTQATWTPLLASTTATGIRLVPANNYTTTPGEAITEGGNDQTTFRGRKKLKYVGYTDVNFVMEGVSPAFATSVRDLTKFSAQAGQRSVLRAFLLTDEDYVISASDFNGLDIHALIVMDATQGGSYKPSNDYGVMFSLDYGWSHDMIGTKASFDVSLLQNP